MTTTTRLELDYLDIGQREKETHLNGWADTLDAAAHALQEVTTVAGLPTASANTNALCIATDVGVGDESWLVYSNGSIWVKICQVTGGEATA